MSTRKKRNYIQNIKNNISDRTGNVLKNFKKTKKNIHRRIILKRQKLRKKKKKEKNSKEKKEIKRKRVSLRPIDIENANNFKDKLLFSLKNYKQKDDLTFYNLFIKFLKTI